MQTSRVELLHRNIHLVLSVFGLFSPFLVHESFLFLISALSVVSYLVYRRLNAHEPNKTGASWWLHVLIYWVILPGTVVVLIVPYAGAPWYYKIAALILVLTDCGMAGPTKQKTSETKPKESNLNVCDR